MQNSQQSQITPAVGRRHSFLPGKVVACHRCHAKKIKCSGQRPCQNCVQAEQETGCVYPQRNRKVKVPQSFIDGLFEEINRLRDQRDAVSAPVVAHSSPTCPGEQPFDPLEADPRPGGPAETSNEREQVTSDQNDASWFDSRNVFHTPILISEAADAAFATRFRQVISDPRAPEPTHLLRVNYANNEALMALVESDISWPSPSRAQFLLEAALKYIGRCYYIVHGDATRESLSQTFLDPTWASPILRCKLWAIFALGELYATKAAVTQSYPGMAYFAKASKMLGFLEERPGADSIETLLLLSMYSLAVNRRYSAYIMSGTAMRSAIVMGLHLSISKAQIPGVGDRERRKRLFWTVYMFDRMWGANLGHPAAIKDDEIQISLPAPLPRCDAMGSEQSARDNFDAEIHGARIELARLLSSIVRSVYSFHRQQQDAQLSARVQQSMQDLQAWVDRLPSRLQINLSMGVSNDLKVLSLHLSFYQCVILATRPILLHALRIQISSSQTASTQQLPQVPVNASALSEACIRCARQSTQLLSQSWLDGSFITFDPFFTQYLFASLTVLAISSVLDGQDNQADRSSFEEASRLLAELKDAGNCVAQEYCHHVQAMQTALSAYTGALTSVQQLRDPEISGIVPAATSQAAQSLPDAMVPPAAGISWTDSSLQQLLSQPALDMQFLEDAVRDPYAEALYRPEYDSES